MFEIAGRGCVLSVLTSSLDATLKGSGACVLLEGAIGIGKSRLLKTVALDGAERGLAVTYIRAGVSDEVAVIRELIGFLRHVVWGDAEFQDRELQDLIRQDANPFLLADRLGELMEDAARRRPLLIVLDDAHRADEFSSVALQGLVRSISSAPVMLLMARRPVSARSLGQHAIGWLCEHATVHLRLGPLDDEAVAALCAGVLGAKPDASVLAWAARCGGNPWLLETMMNAFMEAGRLVIVDGTASVLADSLPASVLRAIHRLLDAVPQGVRNLLLQGGRVGPRFTLEAAASLSGEPAVNLSTSVDEAVHAGLVRRNGQELAFVHEVVGEAVQQIASRAAEPRAAVSETPAHQPESADEPVAPTAPAEQRPDSGTTVTSPGACDCEDVVARLIPVWGEPVEAQRRLARALGVLAFAGRGSEAGRLADLALRTGLAPAAEARLTLDLVPALLNAGFASMSAERLRRTLARADLGDADRSALQSLLAEAAERGRGAPTAGRVLGYGRWSGAASPRAMDRHTENGGPDPAGLRHEPDKAHCDACGRPSWAWLIRALAATDQFEAAFAVGGSIKHGTRAQGASWSESRWHGHRAELLLALGRLGEARVAAEAGLRSSDLSMSAESVPTLGLLARVSLHYGDTATASDHLRLAERLVSDSPPGDRVRLDWALAQFHAACGRAEMAVQTLVNVDVGAVPDMLLFVEAPTAAATIVRLARRAGLTADAECAAGLARRAAELNPGVASLSGAAEHAEGLLRRDTDALGRAAECYRLSGRVLATATATEDMAQEEHDRRRRSQAVELFESALEVYLKADARRDAARVQRKLRRLGVQAGDNGVDRPSSGWESLTPAELRVVRAIVEGKTNKKAASTLFLSPHTVDSHLRRVFGKLGINTRVELTKHYLNNEAS